MSLFARIAKKLRRRVRQKGSVAARLRQPGRNFFGTTAVDLWERRFAFRETPAARAGVTRAIAREKAEAKRRNRSGKSFWPFSAAILSNKTVRTDGAKES